MNRIQAMRKGDGLDHESYFIMGEVISFSDDTVIVSCQSNNFVVENDIIKVEDRWYTIYDLSKDNDSLILSCEEF